MIRCYDVHIPIILSIIGLFIFLNGFFLTRRELSLKSDSNVQFTALSRFIADESSMEDSVTISQLLNSSALSSTNSKGPARKVFLFIVDALRLDFMVHKEGVVSADSPYNKMVRMHRLLEHNASQSLLFGFRAEPPTVTSQRLKSITTGTLPTFIDIGSNLNSSAVVDDNIIDQLVARRRGSNSSSSSSPSNSSSSNNSGDISHIFPGKVVVLGDDTWGALFPTQLADSHLFDSFNTRDLDTVDRGITSHLHDYLFSCPGRSHETVSWDLLVAHFLGVDHIGHTHTAFHPLMGRRLTMMDELLQLTVEALPEDAILLLFGDHGMTDAGEHGGSSQSETDSGLFVYSKKPVFTVSQPKEEGDKGMKPMAAEACPGPKQTLYWDDRLNGLVPTPVASVRAAPRILPQTDLTPTLSRLLGLPIPASSLGMVIPELFLGDSSSSNSSSGQEVLMDGLYTNALQVWRYLIAYWPDRPRSNASPQDHGVPAGDTAVSHQPAHNTNRNLIVAPGLHTHPALVPLEQLLIAAINLHLQHLSSRTCSNEKAPTEGVDTPHDVLYCGTDTMNPVLAAYTAFFRATQEYARAQWTQFKIPRMAVGLSLLAVALAWILWRTALAFSALEPGSNETEFSGLSLHTWSLVCTPLGAVFNSMAAYSDNFTEQERWIVFVLLLLTIVLLAAQARGSAVAVPAEDSSATAGGERDSAMSALRRSILSRAGFMGAALLALHWLSAYTNTSVAAEPEPSSPVALALRIGTPALAALLLHLLYRRLLSSARRLRGRWAVPDDGPLHRVCPLLQLLSVAYLLLYWAIRYGPDSVRDVLASALPVAVESLLGAAFWAFMYTAAAEVDWLVLLPETVLSISTAVLVLAVGALVELKYRPSLRALPAGHRGCLQLSCLLHCYFALVVVVALYSGPAHALQVFAVAFLGVVFLVTVRQVLRATNTSPFQQCPVTQASSVSPTSSASSKIRAILLFSLFSLFYPLSGRLLFFLTAHRMDFGTLQLSAGFIGARDFSFAYAGAALAVNTFGSFALTVLAVRIAALYLQLRAGSSTRAKQQNVVTFANPGEATPVQPNTDSPLVHASAMAVLSYHCATAVHSCVAAALLRRHLMVWRVFAPKLAFEACIWLVVALFHLLLDLLLL